jgi:hypothetical protein
MLLEQLLTTRRCEGFTTLLLFASLRFDSMTISNVPEGPTLDDRPSLNIAHVEYLTLAAVELDYDNYFSSLVY